ncbi:MAG: sigma-70 family RNA polymerase sigma factor [Chitinophagaceae bacterium]|nr:sigma-70 family RNA polymerase sigma factor [Chitinophagaceae bacterium]
MYQVHSSISLDLIEKVAAGEHLAFEQFFYHYKSYVYSIALKITHNETLGEEIVQDVFVRVWKYREKLPEVQDLDAWMRTVTKNRCLTELKRLAKDAQGKNEYFNWQPTEWLSHNSDGQNSAQLLQKAMSRLTPQQQRVFELSFLEGMKRDQIAELLDISPATVGVHLKLAARSVRAFLTNQSDLAILLLILYS